MLSFLTKKRGAQTIPRHLTTLSVSWLNNQFKAIAIHRGVIEGTWEYPGEIEGPVNFESVLAEAVEKTGYHGQTVLLVLAHPRMVQQRVEVPPVKGAALNKLLQRQAQQQKVFQGEAAWASQTSTSNKGERSIILHLFPQTLLDLLVQGARNNGLHLAAVVPPSAVLHRHLLELPLQPEEIALLAAETGNSVSVIAGRGDGQLLLARTIPGNWLEGAERFGVDLNRTILFVNQQFGVMINKGVWLFGRRAAEQAPAVQGQLQLPVQPSPVEYEPFYWATEAAKLAPGRAPNFISPEQQKAPQRRVFATVVAVSTILLVAVALAATIYFSLAARQEQANIRTLTEQTTRLQTRRQALLQRNEDLSHKKQFVQLVIEDRLPPVPLWFLAYLGQAVPPQLVVTNLLVSRTTNDVWQLNVAGTLQQTNEPSSVEAAAALMTLRDELERGPFHVKLSGGIAELPSVPKGGAPDPSIPDWLDQRAREESRRLLEATQHVDHFLIEGTMR